MYPILFSIGGLSVYTYGFFVALGIFTGLMLLDKQATKNGLNADLIGRFAFWAIVFAIVGARVGWVVQYWPMYKGNWLSVLNVREGGLAFHGGLIGAIFVGFYYVFRYKISLAKLADAAALPLCLGYAVGRLGCLFNGCCWGIPTSMPWGVATRFAEGLRHPVQIYDSFLTLVLFAFIAWRSKSTKFGGQLFLETLMGFALVRFLVEFFRDSTKFNAVLNQTQVLMIALFLVPLVIQIINLKRVHSVK
jgi:phosphatidylglycerol:prolipoprotein diacylglycerol transferase